MTETDPANRWQEDPIRGLKTSVDGGDWAARVAKLEHLKATYGELAGDSELAGFLTDIDRALERMQAGTYGLCADCGCAIAEDIIRQSCPWITTCSHFGKCTEG